MLRHMRNKIVMAATIFTIMLSVTGIAAANGIGGGCPGRNSLGSHTQTYDDLYAYSTVDGTVVTYLLNTVNNDASVIGYCVYPTPEFTGATGDLGALYSGWQVSRPDSANYFGFQRGTGSNNVPIDGTTNIQIGRADYKHTEKLPTSDVILLHINDPNECQTEGDTCWRRSGTSQPPVPELGTIVLTSTGMLGLILVSRKYRQK